MEIIHARRSTHPRWYVVSASALRWRAYGAERYPSNLLQWQTVYRVTQFKMIFTQDGKMTRQPRGKAGKKSLGTWKVDASGFARLGKEQKPTAIQSSRAARISGQFKKVPPLLQCGQNSLHSQNNLASASRLCSGRTRSS